MLRALCEIPGVGEAISRDLWRLGIRSLRDLAGADPEELYARLCALEGMPVDRCMLYVFRCAVYYASHERHDPERLKWWNWTGRAAEPGDASGTPSKTGAHGTDPIHRA